MNAMCKPRGFNVPKERNFSQVRAIADECLKQVEDNPEWQEQPGKQAPVIRMRKLSWHCLRGKTFNPEVGQEQ